MSVIHFQPWNLVNRLQRDIERTLARDSHIGDPSTPQQAAEWSPAVDVRETRDAFVLTADVPGVNPKDIEITTENGLLTIRGARLDDSGQNEAQADTSEQSAYRRIERVSGRFLRRFTLPESANVEAVTAKTTHGVLVVTLPKRAQVQPRRVEIQAA